MVLGDGDQAPRVDEALFWDRAAGHPPRRLRVGGPRQDRRRHTRKYAESDLGEEKSFYFRGPGGALNLRAQNLALFLQIAAGVDDRTWLHHLRAGDYSRWFRAAIKDADLAYEAAAIETDERLSAAESRERIQAAVDCWRTGAATGAG